MSKGLTDSQKRKYLPILIQESGFVCYQDDEALGKDYVFEHLDNDRTHNNIENIALSHQSCNIKKINDFDMQLKANDLLKKREEAGLKYQEDSEAHKQHSSEIEINKILYSFHKRYISERIAIDGQYLFDDAIAELPYLCQHFLA